MKTIWTLFAAAVLLTAAAPAGRVELRVSMDFFYDNLDPYGTWREVGDYGYCWQPREVDRDWQPYSDGRWVYTDAGWTWDSEEPYSWAVYHYGRWAFVEDTGWIWVPDTQWGPGWVSWRHSNDYVGWAPLPPEARFIASVGFSSWVDNYYDIGPRHYRFVETRNFGERRLRSRFVDPRENIAIIQNTTNITNITYVNSVVHNGGPRFEELAGRSSQPIQRFRLDRQQQFEGHAGSQRGEMFRSREEGNSLRVFAPPIELRATAAPKRLAERVDRANVNHGWKDAGNAAEVDQLRSQMRSKAQPPAELPPRPKFEKPVVQHASESAGKRAQTQSADAPQGSAGQPRIADKLPVVPRTEPGPRGFKPVLPADEPNRPGKPSSTIGDTKRPPESTVSTPSVRTPGVAPKPDAPPGTPNRGLETQRVRPQDPPTTRMPDKRPDLSGAGERDGKPQRPEESPRSRKPDPTTTPVDNSPPRTPRPQTPAPEFKHPTPSSPSKKAPPPRVEQPAVPPVPGPQRKPEVVPQPPVNKPQATSPTGPPAELEQQRPGKGKSKDKKKDDPDKK